MDCVLVVDDEPQIRRALSTNLRARGFEVAEAATGEEALRIAAERKPDLVVLDLGLPGIDGIDVVHGLRGWTAVPIVILSRARRRGPRSPPWMRVRTTTSRSPSAWTSSSHACAPRSAALRRQRRSRR